MSHVENRPKKKKKNNFLRQTKRHGKKGNYGKGRKLSEDEYNYYMRVYEQLKHVAEEEKEILVGNFFRELEREGEEKSLASNQIVSRILDDTLPLADITHVLHLSQIFLADMRTMCVDPFASHVMQTLLNLSLKYVQEGAGKKCYEESDAGDSKEVTVSVTKEQREEFCSFLEKVSRFVFNNLEDFVYDTYASHIVRSVLEVCSGVEIQKSSKNSQKSQLNHTLIQDEGKILTVPQSLQQLVTEFANRFKRLPNLPDLISHECGSAVLQSLVYVLGTLGCDECESVVDHLLNHGLPGVTIWYTENQHQQEEPPPQDLPLIFLDQPTTRLLEVMVKWSSSEQQQKMFKQYFEGHLKEVVKHRQANCALQRLLATWKDKNMFESVYSEVGSSVVRCALSAGHLGVITALTQACRRLVANQAMCIKKLMKVLGCWEPEERQNKFSMSLLHLSQLPAEGEEKRPTTTVSLQGALALQDLLHFLKPIKVVQSLLESSVSELTSVACDPRGCHVVDAFCDSTSVGAKQKEKFVYKLQGSYSTLACSKHGSRSLEALWRVASVKAKTQLCEELLADEHKLMDSQCGIIIFNKFQVKMFKRGDRGDWQELIDKTLKKRKMFDDLLHDKEDSGSDKKKKKSKSEKPKKEVKSEEVNEDCMFIDTEGMD